MADWTYIGFPSVEAFVDYMNGSLIGTVNITGGADLDGLVFIVDGGSGNQTVTFSPAKNRNWTLGEIIDKINSTHASLAGTATVVRVNPPGTPPDMRLRMHKDGTMIVRFSGGTANATLGYSTTADQTQTIIADTDLYRVYVDPDGQNRVVAVFYA